MWCHMIADTHEELVRFAMRIGLKGEWIQYQGRRWEHFDLTPGKRRQAVSCGAVEISQEEFACIIDNRKKSGSREKYYKDAPPT